ARNAITEGRARFRIGSQWFSRSGCWNRHASSPPARSLERRRSAVLISGLATGPSGRGGWRARTVSGCVNCAFLGLFRTFSGPQPFRPWATSRLQGAPGQTQDLVLGDLSRVDGGRVGHETGDHAIANQVE